MKKGFRHIVHVTLLVLITAYSLPVIGLHQCDRFKVHSNTAVIGEGHAECYLCDLQLNSFIPAISSFESVVFNLICSLAGLCFLSFLSGFIHQFSNKGPPVPVII